MIGTILDLIISGIFLGSLYTMVAVGMSLLYGVSQTINLAHGDFMIAGSYFAFVLVSSMNLSPFLTIITSGCILGLIGVILYKFVGFSRLLKKPVHRSEREFITLLLTFALIWVLTNLIAWIFTANFRTYPPPTGSIVIGDITLPIRKLVPIIVTTPLTVVIWYMVKKTWFGLGIRCVFDDNEAAKLMGIRNQRVHLFIFLISFLLAGVGGALYSMNYPITPYLGVEYTMMAFVATIIGGVGSIKGALVGGMTVGLVESISMFFIAPLLKIAVVYSMLIIVLLIRPAGLFKSM
ncbi:MAG: branched-chain amino acid ABC transporter permease [Candidatus Hadarchaeales archaeon]